MNYHEFQNKIALGVQKILGDSVSVKLSSVHRNNGGMREGLTITREGINISPNIHLNEFYEAYCQGQSFASIIQMVVKLYDQIEQKENVDMDFFTQYEQVRTRLSYKLVNYENNQEWLRELAHIRYLDMAIVFQCLMYQERMEHAVIHVTKEHCAMWQVDEQTLFEQAKKNAQKYSKASITSMEEVIREILEKNLCADLRYSRVEKEAGEEEWIAQTAQQMIHTFRQGEQEIPMFILTNQTKINGAAAMLYEGVLKHFAEEKCRNFYILPSSVHEVILVPDSGRESASMMRKMVCEVNDTQVEKEEKLSDSVYYYDRIADAITRCAC